MSIVELNLTKALFEVNVYLHNSNRRTFSPMVFKQIKRNYDMMLSTGRKQLCTIKTMSLTDIYMQNESTDRCILIEWLVGQIV